VATGVNMTKEIYLKQYQEARGTVTMPGESMWVDKWEVCVKFDSLSEAQTFRNEIESPKPNLFITMRVKDSVSHTGIEKLGLTVHTEKWLKADDVISIEQLECCTEQRLLKTPNLGRKAINEIKERMAEFGYKLRGQE
jgi:DNA-directed RNA polymerase alpha subunit